MRNIEAQFKPEPWVDDSKNIFEIANQFDWVSDYDTNDHKGEMKKFSLIIEYSNRLWLIFIHTSRCIGLRTGEMLPPNRAWDIPVVIPPPIINPQWFWRIIWIAPLQ